MVYCKLLQGENNTCDTSPKLLKQCPKSLGGYSIIIRENGRVQASERFNYELQ
jgi:hypothetical protein